MHFPTLTSILSAFSLLLLVSENARSVLAVPLRRPAEDSSNLETRSSDEETLVKRGRTRTPKVTSNRPLKASDLKSSNYRKTALANNNGAFVKTAGGSQVKWKKGADGEAEHVIEPGSHIKDALNQFGIKKNHPFVGALKKTLNHKDNLSMLNPDSNKAKAHITTDPNRNAKDKASAQHYMQHPTIMTKASITAQKIQNDAKKYKVERVFPAIKAKIKMSWPHIKRDTIDLD